MAIVFHGQVVNAALSGLEAHVLNMRTPLTIKCLNPLAKQDHSLCTCTLKRQVHGQDRGQVQKHQQP
eukprot:7185438-Pyramimonas_sp.AAC.1